MRHVLILFLPFLPLLSLLGGCAKYDYDLLKPEEYTGPIGRNIDKLSIHRKGHVARPPDATVAGRWAHHVGRHPVRYALASFAVLCAIAVPAVSMHIGTPDDGNAAAGTRSAPCWSIW